MKILVTGGGGYVGTRLVNKLLDLNHEVIVVDIFWFPNFLKKEKNLKIIKKDIIQLTDKHFKDVNTIIHLASMQTIQHQILIPN